MPEVKLDATDAAELAEMLQFLTGWLARDPAASPYRSKNSWATRPMGSPSCTRTWNGSSSCSAGSDGEPLFGPGRGTAHAPPLAAAWPRETTVTGCLHRRRSWCTGSRRSTRASQGPSRLPVAKITWS